MPRISTRSSACRLGISACGAVLRPGSGRSLGSQPGYLPMRLGTSCARCWQLTRRMQRWRASLGAVFGGEMHGGASRFFDATHILNFHFLYLFIIYRCSMLVCCFRMAFFFTGGKSTRLFSREDRPTAQKALQHPWLVRHQPDAVPIAQAVTQLGVIQGTSDGEQAVCNPSCATWAYFHHHPSMHPSMHGWMDACMHT
jgi:hypothetical protein